MTEERGRDEGQVRVSKFERDRHQLQVVGREPLKNSGGVVLLEIQRMEPTIDTSLASALAEVFEWEVAEIIRLTMDYTREEIALSPHFTLKDEMVAEYAQFAHHVSTVVLKAHAEGGFSSLDPIQELQRATGPRGREKIRNTARVYAERVWVPLFERWNRRTDGLLRLQARGAILPPRSIWTSDKMRQKRTQLNHFVPQFISRAWADAGNDILEYRRGLDGLLAHGKRPVARWAAEEFLYSQHIEDYFASIVQEAPERQAAIGS